MSGERGAALLELLLALTLTAALATTMVATARFGLAATERAEARGAAVGAVEADRRRLAALWARVDGEAAFDGGPTRVVWRGPAPEGARWGLWRLEAGDPARLAACAGTDARAPGPCGPDEALALAATGFAYAGPDGALASVWTGAGAPALVALEGPRRLVVAPRAAP